MDGIDRFIWQMYRAVLSVDRRCERQLSQKRWKVFAVLETGRQDAQNERGQERKGGVHIY